MSNPFLGEIRAVSYNFAPRGWALCNGQLLPLQQYTALFALLGTYYGGDGRRTFGLPDLQGASPLAPGQGPGLTPISLGESSGSDTVTLLGPEMPVHTHAIGVVNAAGNQESTKNAALAEARVGRVADLQYGPLDHQTAMNPQMLGPAGGSQPHNNMPPYLVVNFIIALEGMFPPRG